MSPEFACTACGRISDQRRCPEHRSSTSLVNGSTRRWRKTRQYVLNRDPYCTLKLVCAGDVSTVVDHIIAREAGGTDHPSNLRGCCSDCHKQRHGGRSVHVSSAPIAPTPVKLV